MKDNRIILSWKVKVVFFSWLIVFSIGSLLMCIFGFLHITKYPNDGEAGVILDHRYLLYIGMAASSLSLLLAIFMIIDICIVEVHKPWMEVFTFLLCSFISLVNIVAFNFGLLSLI